MIPNATYQRVLELFPALRTMSEALDRALAAQAMQTTVPAGTILFDEGAPCRIFPLLMSGSMKVVKAAASGREIVLYRKEPGEICPISSSCLLGQVPYSVRGEAETELSMIGLNPSLFEDLMAGHVAFRRMVFAEMSLRLSELMQLVEAVAFAKTDQRLARLLMDRGDLAMSHQQIAEELGSVREVISRLLRNFEVQGMVRLGREHVIVINRERLQQAADGN